MAAVLMTRREATAEASLARRRERRKLGMAIAAIIRITETTRSSSIKENPLWLRINSPQAGASVRGRGQGNAGRARHLSSVSHHPEEFYSKRRWGESNTFPGSESERASLGFKARMT